MGIQVSLFHFNRASADLASPQAPDVLQVGTTYYLTYAISLFGSQNSAIGVATSATLEPKSWIDHGETGVISKRGDPCNAIDSNLIKVGNEFLSVAFFSHPFLQETNSLSV